MATISLVNASLKQLLDEVQKRVDATSTTKLPLAQRLGTMRVNELREICNPDSDAYKLPTTTPIN